MDQAYQPRTRASWRRERKVRRADEGRVGHARSQAGWNARQYMWSLLTPGVYSRQATLLVSDTEQLLGVWVAVVVLLASRREYMTFCHGR